MARQIAGDVTDCPRPRRRRRLQCIPPLASRRPLEPDGCRRNVACSVIYGAPLKTCCSHCISSAKASRRTESCSINRRVKEKMNTYTDYIARVSTGKAYLADRRDNKIHRLQRSFQSG